MTAKKKTDTKKKANKPAKMGFMAKVKTWPVIRKILNPPPVVTVVRLSGVIGQVSAFKSGLTMESVAHQLDEAFDNDKAKAVALVINSPGGSPVQSSLIGKRIRDLAIEHKKKVFVFIEDVAASGGYWLACAADEIYTDKNSVIGSIGVISAGFGFPGLIKKYGVERRVYTSGKSKSVLDPFQPEKAEDVKKLKALQEEVHAHFIAWVKERRGKKLKQKDSVVFTGEFWAGETAKAFGLVDEIGDLRSVMRAKYGKKVKFKLIRDETPWWKKKLPIGVSEERLAGAFRSEFENMIDAYGVEAPFKLR